MAYFNYFIKCIIRNIAYKLCKPKVFLTVLLSVAILFILHSTGYCSEWTDAEIEACLDGLADITNNQGVMISLLSSIGVDVSNLENQLTEIKSSINDINTTTSNISAKITTLLSKVDFVNTNIMSIYNKLDENQRELINTIETNNDEVVGLLTEIKSYLAGDTIKFSQNYTPVSNINMSSNTFTSSDWTSVLYFPYDKNYSYTINIVRGSVPGSDFNCIIGGGFSIPSVNNTYTYVNSHSVNSNETYKFTVNSGLNFDYIYIRSFSDLTVTIEGNNEQSGLNGLNNSINQGNQLQQEQNDFLKDDNVGVDSSTLPSDTTENITSDGFNSIFQQLYTTFTSSASQDVVISIPFTNKSFTINANSVYGNANLGFVKTLIQTFWYFVISYFIVQDIAKKINKIKSGDIEHVQDDNIKEDIL